MGGLDSEETVPVGPRFTKKMWCLFGTIQDGLKGMEFQPDRRFGGFLEGTLKK